MAKVNKKNIYEIINERIFKLLEKGEIPWQKPWISGDPANFVTKRPYRGINPFILISSGYSCPYWVSFKQAKGKGGRVKKGEKGFPVVFWKWIEKDDQDTKSGKRTVPLLRYYRVYNLEQTEGIIIPELPQRNFQPLPEAERIILSMPRAPAIEHKQPQAYYLPSQDLVNMPNANLFKSDEEYYSTLFHELTHSTGHASRLNRDELSKINMLRSHDYSKEELVAEMGSAFLCGRCGIMPKVIVNQAAYIQSWLKQLKNNRKWLVYAAAQAQKAADFILGIDFENGQKDDQPVDTALSTKKSHLN